jgi:hypothetical protein
MIKFMNFLIFMVLSFILNLAFNPFFHIVLAFVINTTFGYALLAIYCLIVGIILIVYADSNINKGS